jgi:phosphoglucosamine mutase
MTKQFFGTDGIRGAVGQYPITPDFFLKLGWAIGRVFAKEGKGVVLLGKDTRISGYMFESALEAGLSAAGVDTHLLGPMPTPGIAYLTRTLRAKVGIVISASHNPYYDNGIKFFSTEGTKLADDLEYQIEAYLDKPMTTVESGKLGKAKRLEDAAGRYIEFCKASVESGIDFNGLRIVVDCANGATYHIAPHVFTEVGAEVVTIAANPDGININDNCGATQPEQLQAAVIEYRADLGIALDGDGDRLIMVDHKGEVVDGDELIFIIAKALYIAGELRGPVIGTVMTNLGMEHALNKIGIKLIRANVGDRYVMQLMKKHNSGIGGEGSGHLICLDKTTTGDAIVAALQVLAEVNKSGRTLYDLKSEMNKYPQVLLNVRVDKKIDLAKNDIIQKAVQSAEKILADKGRVLLRSSGTEPLIRVMVEGVNEAEVTKQANLLVEAVKQAIQS